MSKCALLFIGLIFVQVAKAQDYNSAIGIRYNSYSSFGGPAISYKHFIKGNGAIEANVSLRNPAAIGVVYQVHKPFFTNGLQWYYGGGGYFVFSQPKAGIGAVGVIGLDYTFEEVPLNFSIDLRPELALLPNFGLDINTVGFSIRYVIK